jgi:transposase
LKEPLLTYLPMPAPYSIDLREKAVAAVDRGEKKSHVSKLFHLSRNTLDLWLKQREQTGTVAPKVPIKKGPDPKIKDLEAFRRFAETHGHLTAVVMAQRWPEPISDVTIGKALRRIDFTRKKRLTATASGMKSSEPHF